MLLVVDPNVVISAVLNIGNSLSIFALNNITKKFEFIAPEFLLIELSKHTEKLAKKTAFSENDVKKILEFIIRQIEFIPKDQFEDKLKEAKEILKSHEKDVPYLALALKLNCNIFSGDKKFKELCLNRIKTPKELLDEFY
jgi:predicted nucleic acid-binding protein